MKHTFITLSCGALLLAGCADKSANIQAAYVSPIVYQNYDCDDLVQEYQRVIEKSHQINKQQDDIASNDSAAMGVGLILFWPALFFIDNDDHREEVARLKGLVDTIEKVAIEKKCRSLLNNIEGDRDEAAINAQ